MLKYVTGNILTPNKNDDKAVVVCHQVNCQGVMGSGLARQVKSMFPEVFNAYKKKCNAFGGKNLGDAQLCSCLAPVGYIVANLFGQDRYGRDKQYTDYEALRSALYNISGMDNTVYRIPYKMGCGLGGGDWDRVLDIIQEELVDKGCEVEIWTLPNPMQSTTRH